MRHAPGTRLVCNGDHSHARILDLIDTENGSWMRFNAPQGLDYDELIASADKDSTSVPTT